MASCPNCKADTVTPALLWGLSLTEPRCKSCGSYWAFGALPQLSQVILWCTPYSLLLAFLIKSQVPLLSWLVLIVVSCALALLRPGIRILSVGERLDGSRKMIIGLVGFLVFGALYAVLA